MQIKILLNYFVYKICQNNLECTKIRIFHNSDVLRPESGDKALFPETSGPISGVVTTLIDITSESDTEGEEEQSRPMFLV